jgi:hypothetical protein
MFAVDIPIGCPRSSANNQGISDAPITYANACI